MSCFYQDEIQLKILWSSLNFGPKQIFPLTFLDCLMRLGAIDEMDTSGQFHQRSVRSFYARRSRKRNISVKS